MGSSSSKQKKTVTKPKQKKGTNRAGTSSSVSAAAKRDSNGSIKQEPGKQPIYTAKKGGGARGSGGGEKPAKNVKIQEESIVEIENETPSSTSKIVKSISFSDKSATQVTKPPVYRKKSMCYPLDIKDLNFEELRTRSGSDKSLRFSDFTKLVRQTALYDWEMAPADIPLYGVDAPRYQSVCYICGVYTGSVMRSCRICYQVYHDGCLSKIGHALDKQMRQLSECDSWSCHQCRVLSHLLTRGDVQEIQGHLQDLNMNPGLACRK